MVKMTVELKNYALNDRLDDEEDAIQELKGHESGYISDMIAETADSYTPIYDYDVWRNASDISDSVDEAMAEGLVSLERDASIVNILRTGYYKYYSDLLHANLDIVIFNKIAEKVNDYINDNLTEEQLKEMGVDFDIITWDIEEKVDNFDNGKDFSDIDDIASEIINLFLTEEEED